MKPHVFCHALDEDQLVGAGSLGDTNCLFNEHMTT